MQRVLQKRVPNALRDEAKPLIHCRASGLRPEHEVDARVHPMCYWPCQGCLWLIQPSPGPACRP